MDDEEQRVFMDEIMSRHLKIHGSNPPVSTDDFFTGFTEWINSLNMPDKNKLSAEDAAGVLTAAMIAGVEESLRKESDNEFG